MATFYTQLTSKRGPLSKIWLAAHWERKITRTHVFECNLESTIKEIICPQIKVGLRTSGHLLLGVVRIYSRKTKYLLEDCNNAVVKIKVEFRPGQADMLVEGLASKDITLMEDFTAFETIELPDVNTIDVVDHFTLNQCRNEEITLKEDYGNVFFPLEDFGDNSQSYRAAMDMSFQSLGQPGDGFGDENTVFDLADDIMADSSEHIVLIDETQNDRPETPQMAVNQEDYNRSEAMEEDPPAMTETTLLANEEEGFALEPVAVTSTSEKKSVKRRRRMLVVDEVKQLSNNEIGAQVNDCADLVVPLDIAPPTRRLMRWKESGGVDRLFSGLCAGDIHPQLQQLHTRDVFRERKDRANDDLGYPSDTSVLPSDEYDGPEAMRRDEELTLEYCQNTDNDGSRLEISHPDLPSEDSMFVHPSGFERETQSTVIRTQSLLDSQDVEDRRMTSQAQNLLNALRSQSSSSNNAMFSLQTLCEGSTRSQAAATFFSLLLLHKQLALHLHQSGIYTDITATPGPRFHDS